MKKLDWYIIKKFVGTFFFAILILAVVASVIDYSEKVDDFVSKKVPTSEILNYFKNFIPHISALLFPLFLFIATIFFTSKLAYRSEVIAMLAGGVSFQRFLRPYFIGGGALCLLSLFANHWVVPNANKQRLAFENKYIHNAKFAPTNLHLRLTKTLFIYIQNYDFVTNTGNRFTAEDINGIILKQKLFADRIVYDSAKRTWHLYNVIIRDNDSLKEKLRFLDRMDMNYPFIPKDLIEDEDIKESLTTPELNRYIEKEKIKGRESLNFFYVERDRRTAQPVAGLILTIIGACIASRKIRGGSGVHLAFGICMSALYELLLQFGTTFSTKAGLNSIIACWIPNIVFAVVAVYLYRRQAK